MRQDVSGVWAMEQDPLLADNPGVISETNRFYFDSRFLNRLLASLAAQHVQSRPMSLRPAAPKKEDCNHPTR